MDSFNSSSNPEQFPLKRKSENIPFTVLNKKSRYCYDSYFRQNFSLPDSIIYYIEKHPSSPKMYQKLIQSCKYFFIKNPILISPYLIEYSEKTNKWNTSFGEIDVEKIVRFKLWITDHLSLWCKSNKTNLASSVIPKLYRCVPKRILLDNQIISYNDYIFLASTVEENICLYRVIVKDEDGSIVSLENLVKIATKVKRIHFKCHKTFSNISSNTMKELIKIHHFSKLVFMSLENISEVFDFNSFYLYMKKNIKTDFWLTFDDSISVEYKNQLKAIVDEILRSKLDYCPPAIRFSGLNEEKETKLYGHYKLFKKLK